MAGIYPLTGTVKHYDWGGYSFIPFLLHIENNEKKPFAEYWLGTHPLGMGLAETAEGILTPLNSLSGNLSYLFKAQDVKEMLSIQVHPSKEAAEIEFARENAAGIPLDAPHRNYKDDNHKPEMLVAQSDFWLLHGFKKEEEIAATLGHTPELAELLPVFTESGYAGLYKYVMEMPQEEVNRILWPLINRINKERAAGNPDKQQEAYWVAKAHATFTSANNIDRGIFSIYLLNIVALKKGEGLFQDAGVPHAYLEGQCVEIMANSDNVLRGGLTTKHIDVKELLRHVTCRATVPAIINGDITSECMKWYKTPSADTGFRLSVFELAAGETTSFTPDGVEILLLTEGTAEADDDKETVKLEPGNPSAVVLPGHTIYLAAASKAIVFRASGTGTANKAP
jgi:mannose-6-phosphate isomerase